MARSSPRRVRAAAGILLVALVGTATAFAGISRALQDRYRRNYDNKALFLKVPIFADRQHVFIIGTTVRPEPAGAAAARFKVGDQVRVLGIDFSGDEIRFKLSAISGTGLATLVFKFDAELTENFPNSAVFDRALAATFTEGMKFSDLDEAKRGYVEDQFERAARDLATTTGTTREFVLKSMAEKLPAYQDAQRDVENLKARNQELSGQIAQTQSENRRLEGELRQQQAEVGRLRTLTTSLQEKIDASSSQLSRLGDELKSSKGMTQGYQSQLANLQRSLNLKVDQNRDLAGQISDLAQATKKLQKDNETFETQTAGLRKDLETERGTGKRLAGEVDELKSSNRQLNETISTLTSKEDSIARQYLELKRSKENLENAKRAVDSLRTRVVEEKTESGVRYRKLQLLLREIPLGNLELLVPERLSPEEQKTAELRFSTESIDYVKIAPDERQILRGLGERLKLRAELHSESAAMQVKSDPKEATHELGERDRATWRWEIANRGVEDGRLRFAVALVDKHSEEIPVLREEHAVASASVVRQVRTYLQPIPLAVGAVLGFLLFGIVGIFRKGKRPVDLRKNPPAPTPYVGQKQL